MTSDRTSRQGLSPEHSSEGGGVAPVPAAANACCYTIDEGYLLPTLLSASQLRRGLTQAAVDVIVVCFASASTATRAAEEFCAEFGLRFMLVPAAVLDGNSMMCARFLLPQILGSTYADILYLDGDTQVAGSLTPLLAHVPEPGYVLAAPDPMAVMINSPVGPWPGRRAYFRSIGIHGAQQERYFNSGVMRVRMSDWDAISRDCLDLYRREGARFVFRDQDALNLVVGDRRGLISFRWNFPPFFMNFGAEATICPRVYHFMSNPRPWHGGFVPWGPGWHAPYAALAAAQPELARTMRLLPATRYYRYIVQQRIKRFHESRTWGTPSVRDRINALEAHALV